MSRTINRIIKETYNAKTQESKGEVLVAYRKYFRILDKYKGNPEKI